VIGVADGREKKFEQGKMARKKICTKKNPKEKIHAEEGSHFGIKTVLLYFSQITTCSKRWCLKY